MTALNTCSWGGMRLYYDSIDGEAGRTLAVHGPARGDGYVVQDRGRAHKTCNLEVVFTDVEGEAGDYLSRAAAFLAMIDEGVPRLFVHPTRGSYRASIGQCRESISATAEEARYAIEVIPVSSFQPVLSTGAGTTPIAGPEAVATAQALASGELGELGVDDGGLTAETVAIAEGWAAQEEPDSRPVFLQYAEAVQDIDLFIEANSLRELPAWQAYRDMIALRSRLREAAQAATQSVANVRQVTIRVPVPLLSLCAREFGAAEARKRADQVAQMNDIRERDLLPAGTYRLPVAEVRRT